MIDLSQLHFLRPWAWWVLPLLLAAGWWFWRHKSATMEWKNYLEPHLASWLLESSQQQQRKLQIWPIIFILSAILVSFSAAGPAWEKQPVAISSSSAKAVILLDLSPSMTVEDITPSRISRARFKILEILKRWKEGHIALVAYADDGYIISPLTDDADTISNMVNILSPTVMPAQGSAVDAGLERAIALLKQSADGTDHGDILLITDGVSEKRKSAILRMLKNISVRLSILSIGTQQGAPIQSLTEPGFITDSKGAIVIAKMRQAPLQAIAATGNGIYMNSQATNDDILSWLNFIENNNQQQFTEIEGKQFDKFIDMGSLFLIPVLFLFAYIFRKGLLFSFIFCIFTFPLDPLKAAEQEPQKLSPPENQTVNSIWDSLWYNSEQLGDKAMSSGKPDQALEHYQSPKKIAEASYRAGQYQQAAKMYANQQGAEARYNQANALAQNKQLEEAITNYQQALEINPNMENAKKNLETVKKLLQQQKNQQQQEQQKGDGEKQNKDESKSKDGEDSEQKQSEQQKSDKSSDSDDPKQSKEQTPEQEEKDEQSEQEKEKSEKEQKEQQQAKDNEAKEKPPENSEQATAPKTAEEIEAEKQQQQMIEQWLRQINDDPSRLLRNKLRLKQRERERSGKQSTSDDTEW